MYNLKIIKSIQVYIHSIDVIGLSVRIILSQEKTIITCEFTSNIIMRLGIWYIIVEE